MATTNHTESPLGWSASEDGPDVSVILSNVRTLCNIATALEASNDVPGSLFVLMDAMHKELNQVEAILGRSQNGGAA